MVDKLSGQVELIEVSSRRGRAATIAIGTITTGAPGTSASVTNSGTAGEAVLDFTIPTGENVELRTNGGYIQWKTTEAETWNNLIEIADMTATIDIGTVTTGDPNTDVLVTNSGAGKDAVFNFTIPRGDSVELRIDGGYIQWKTTTATTWNNLHAVSAITPTITVGTVTTGNAGTNVAVTNSGTGKDGIFNFTIPRGDDVQLRIDSGYLQWKNTTASTWTNIVQITDITATIEVGTVTTGAAGTSVTFVNAGSGKDAIFNLSIPKGTTFTPSVSAEGVISFTNDGGLDNPTSVNIKGDKGDPGNLTGPASSVDENIPIFDGVTGDKLKDSGVKLRDKADVTAVTAGLLLKADITSLEIEKKLLMDEIDSLKKSAIENSNAPYLTVSDYGDVALAKNSVGVGTVGIDGVTVEELLNFFSGYSNTHCTSVYSDESLISSATGADFFGPLKYYIFITAHKYYFRTKARVLQSDFTKLTCRFLGGSFQVEITDPISNQWYTLSSVKTSTGGNGGNYIYGHAADYAGKQLEVAEMIIFDLTEAGMESLTAEQLDRLAPEYFSGTKTFSGVGCLVSKDSAESETGRMYFSTTPMYSNATAKDTLTYSGGKYYHTHNVDSDGVAIAEPYDTEVETNGQFLALSEGTVTYEPWYPDIGVYTDKFTLTKAITAVKELYKYGSATPITDAVIAGDGLSFTSASLTAGDLAYGVFEFNEPLRPLMTVESRNDDATVVDTVTGTVYMFRPVVTNGAIASWELTEV